MIRKNPDRDSEVRWGLTAARRRHRQSRQLRGCPGAAPSAAREWGAERSSGAGPGIASRPDPVAGINWDTVRAPAADVGRRQARAARHPAGVPGLRLMPAAQPAKPPGTPPGDDDLDAAAAHPGQGGGRQPALPAGHQPARGAWPLGTGGTPRVGPVRGKDCHRPGSATGTDPGRGWTAPSPAPKTPCGKPADRAGKTRPVPSRRRRRSRSPWCSLMLMSGLAIPYCVAGAHEARQLRGTDLP
jgi:hypothetical protein